MSEHDPWGTWQTVTVSGLQLRYGERGDGVPVIFIHGGGATDARTWGPQLDPFAERHHVICYSQRYHYPNTAVAGYPGLNDTQAHAGDLLGIIQALGLPPAHLVTTSYGGNIALLLALRHPEVVRSLALSEPGLLHWLIDLPPDGPALYAAWVRDATAIREVALTGNPERTARAFADVVMAPGAFEKLPPPAQARMRDNAPLLSVPFVPTVDTELFSPVMAHSIQTPTLLLTGERSPRMFLMVADELSRALPQVDRVEIASASHLLHGMNPGDYNTAVLAWLARH
ncbi:MAG TPA: alpha/beta hydrolase [Ktedonobacterales bacterium]